MRRAISLLSAVAVVGAILAVTNGIAGASSAPPSVTFSSTQVGTSGTTPTFSMSGQWAMNWSFNCANVAAPVARPHAAPKSVATATPATITTTTAATGTLVTTGTTGTTGTTAATSSGLAVAVNQPTTDPIVDLGTLGTGQAGTGVDYFYDAGTFSLSVLSTCKWSITVSPSATAPLGTPATFSSATAGVVGNTRAFTVAGAWTLHWSYDCASFGSTGNFIVELQQLTGTDAVTPTLNELGPSGTGTDSEPAGGTYAFDVLSECTWSITVDSPAGTPQPATTGFTAFTRIDGQTADATAAAELEHQFPTGACPGTTGARAVVLATDVTYPDALASAYLARSLGTGTLLTPSTTLSAPALAAIEAEGITTVDVVGGPLAVTTSVVQQLESTRVTACGGGALSGAATIQVQRIDGVTQYATAAAIASAVPVADVGTASFAGAYGGTNGLGGAGLYNQTAGTGSAAPTSPTPLPTAILATGTGFQDAESASTLSYAGRLPILLTTPATLSQPTVTALKGLGIKQVIVTGGPLAVSDSVVSALESLGVSVLRIAGQTFSATSTELATFETQPSTGMGWSGTGAVTVARGNGFTDGLAGAVVAADGPRSAAPSPLVLTIGPTTVGPALTSFLKTAGTSGIGGAKVTRLTVLGGPYAIAQSAINAMGAALGG